jgi:PAS domain S-box-containing protein
VNLPERLLRLLMPFLYEPGVRAREMRERSVLVIVALIGGPLLCLYAWQNFQKAQLWFGAVTLAAGLALVYSFFRARICHERAGPRVAYLCVILVLCVAMYTPNDRLTLNWATTLPILLVFLFGLREGIGWILLLYLTLGGLLLHGLLTGQVPAAPAWPNWNQFLDFSVAYVLVAGCTIGYESLRRAAERTAREGRRQAEVALEARRRSEQRLRDFSETASDWLFELDRELRIIHLSGRFEEITGVPTADFIGRPFANALPDWEIVAGEQDLSAHLLAREPFRDARLELRTPDGRPCHLSMRGHPLFEEDGAFAGYRATGTDVTATEEARRELRETSRALQQASKMEAVGQLTSGVAHDFNNLLTVIIGNLELVETEFQQAGLDGEELEQARAAAERAADLTGKLLAFSRRQSLKPEAVQTHGLLADTTKLLKRTLPASIDVSTHVDADCWLARVDRSQLESALLNLALNARDAMNGTGRLEIHARNAPLDAESAAQWSVEAGDYVRVGVRDTGCGIEAAMLEHIFEPFFSTKPTGQGTGLGLSMVYGFVRQSGGGIRVQSEPGRGTSVEFVLPRATLAGVRDQSRRVAPSRHGDDRPVLVIEDEAAVRNLVVSMLRRLGYAPTAAASGEEGVELFRSLRPELVLSDVVLAGAMTGVDALNAIRTMDPEIPALFMSGYSEAVFRGQTSLPADVGLLPKPFGLAELEERLAALPLRRPATTPGGAPPDLAAVTQQDA